MVNLVLKMVSETPGLLAGRFTMCHKFLHFC